MMAKRRYWVYKSARSISSWHQYLSIPLPRNFIWWTPRTAETDDEGEKMSFCPWYIMNSMCSVAPITVRNVDNRYSGMARQAIYSFNIEARSRTHCCSGKENILHVSDCVFVALSIQHIMRMRHTVSCFFPHCLITGRIVETTILIFSKTFVCNISHSKKKWARYNQKCLLVFL